MPTVYTADVGDGKLTDFNVFALRCARNFGALIELHDEPMDAPIPEAFKPSEYNVEALAKAKERLGRVQEMTLDDAKGAAEMEHARALKSWREAHDRTNTTLSNYQVMLAKVQAWKPPTKDHAGLREFMEQQLTDSIKFDCNDWPTPQPMLPKAWLAQEIKSAEHDVAYREKELREEVKRVEGRNSWVRELRGSLNQK